MKRPSEHVRARLEQYAAKQSAPKEVLGDLRWALDRLDEAAGTSDEEGRAWDQYASALVAAAYERHGFDASKVVETCADRADMLLAARRRRFGGDAAD